MIGIKCLECKKEFIDYTSNHRKFCSRKCHYMWSSENRIGDKNKNWEGGKIKCNCKICGYSFGVDPNVIKRGRGKFCSFKCYSKWKHENQIGENATAWKGGRTLLQSKIRTSEKYLIWRKEVFTRDSFSCQECGQINGYLHAHHKKRFSVIINDIKQKYPLLFVSDMAKNYSELWDISNGITLCKKCHRKEHKKQ